MYRNYRTLEKLQIWNNKTTATHENLRAFSDSLEFAIPEKGRINNNRITLRHVVKATRNFFV